MSQPASIRALRDSAAVAPRNSQQIQFPGGLRHVGPLDETLTITVETGVVIFLLSGAVAHDWTRDTVTFPAGQNTSGFVRGITSASTTSFWTPLKNVSTDGGGSGTVFVQLGPVPVVTRSTGGASLTRPNWNGDTLGWLGDQRAW
jgi:hypothetical protein